MPSTDAILDRQLRRWELERRLARTLPRPEAAHPVHQPVITISRQRGSGGTLLAGQLAERFDYTLLHRDLLDRICATTGYQRRLLETLDEHTRSEIAAWLEAMFAGRYITASDYVRALLETVLAMSQLGGVVVVGRGANFIIGHDRGFHVRVVAPRDVRIRRLIDHEGLSPHDAEHTIDVADRERREFIRKVYGADIDDPLGYDLVLNRAGIPVEAAVSLVAMAALEKFERLRADAAKAHA